MVNHPNRSRSCPRTLHLCIASGGSGKLIIDRPDSTRDTHCAVLGVPGEVSATDAMLHLERLMIWPWPKTLLWSDVAGLPVGSLVKTSTP